MSPNAKIVMSDTARQRQAMRDLGALPWAPRSGGSFRALGWCVVVLMLCAALMGLLAVGK